MASSTMNYERNRFVRPDSTDGQSLHNRVAIAIAVVFITYCCYYYTRTSKSRGIYHLSGIPILTARTFFKERFDFLWTHFKRHDFFQFRVLHHKVVAISGEEARKAFFGDHRLDLIEGYKILMGTGPSLEDIQKTKHIDTTSEFNKILARLMHKERLIDVLPTLLTDVNKRMDTWGKSGKIDPFVDVYNIVFQMTARLGTCRAISEEHGTIDKLAAMFMAMQTRRSPIAVLLPWFPSRDRNVANKITSDLYTMIHDHVEARRKETPTSDAIDILIGEGYSTNDIVQTTLSILYAGVLNTGIISCWVLIELALNPKWKEKVYKEALDLVNKHVGPRTTDTGLHERLGLIPLPAWEDELPTLDLCLRETLRMYITGAALRRNVDNDLNIGDKVVEKGAFLVYSVADVHLNSNIYSNPEKFDPCRFTVGAEEVDSQTTYPFLGWGAGRHPCTGMRVAKFEMKLLLVLFILSFDYKLVDKEGRLPNPLPRANKNDVHQARPIGKPCYLEYKRITASS